jgi:hypothetical protein
MILRHAFMRVVLSGALLLLSACSAATTDRNVKGALSQASSAPSFTPVATATLQPTPSAIPPAATMPPTVVPLPTDQDLAQLKALIAAQLPTAQAAPPEQPIEINVLPLTSTGTLGPIYAAYTTGAIFDPNSETRHGLMLYRFAGGRWEKVQQISVDNANYVSSGSVQQVSIEPNYIWLEVQSGVGAHSGCYDLFAFEPESRWVSQHISSCSSSPGAGYVADVNGDGQLDVVLDATDYYVFCYACGVTKPQYSVLAWDGAQLSEVTLSTVFDTTPAEAQQINNQAVQLAHAGLWKDAQAAIEQARTLKADSSIVRWNAALIKLQVEALQEQIQAQTYPLLNHLFYGDYAAVLDVLRAYPPADLFRVNTPLVADTPAEYNLDSFTTYINEAANAALQANPDLAAAYFLRGWATYLQDPGSVNALHDVERAAQLDPGESLYAQSVVYLKR